MSISERQIKAMLALSASQRYRHFIGVVTDWEEAWGLYRDGWALAGTARGERVFPLWPAQEYASLCAVDDWTGYLPRPISFEDLLDSLLPELRNDQMSVGVFYTPADKGGVVSPESLAQDLSTELGRYL